jgi:RNA polymerase sigma factor (sigma-70 family)
MDRLAAAGDAAGGTSGSAGGSSPGDSLGSPGDRLSDASLIEWSLREPDRFAVIFDRHAAEILRYAHARLGPDLAEDITAEQLRPRLIAVLGGLPRLDRELLLLVAWAGLTYEEAAQALGLTVSAVRSRLNRIRVRTRKELGGANPARIREDNASG